MVRNGLKSLFALFFLNKVLIVNSIVVTPEYPKKNDPVILAANASGLPTVTWQKNNSILTSCYLQAGICGDETILPGANIKIDQTTNITTIEIASANQSFYGGVYTASGSTNVNLIINTLPASMNWTTQPQGNLTTVSSATWTAKIYCVYPTSSVKVDFTVFVEGIKEVSSRSLALSNETDPICDSPEKTIVASLTLSSSEFRNKKVYIIANASHASFPNEPSITSGQSVETTFQGDHTSTSAPITKPPPVEICFNGNGCPIGTTMIIVIPIVVLTIAGCLIYQYRKKTKRNDDKKSKRQPNDSENPVSSEDCADLCIATANKTHTGGANREYDNQSRSTNHDKKSKYTTNDKTINDSLVPTDNMKQEGSVCNDDPNIGSKNDKKDESKNRSDGDPIGSTSADIKPQSGANDKTLNQSTVSANNTNQERSVCNDDHNNGSKSKKKEESAKISDDNPIKSTYAAIQPKFGASDKKLNKSTVSANNTKQEGSVCNDDQNNGSKNEKKDESEKGSDDYPSVSTSAGIKSQSGANDKTLYQSSVSTNKTKQDEHVVNI